MMFLDLSKYELTSRLVILARVDELLKCGRSESTKSLLQHGLTEHLIWVVCFRDISRLESDQELSLAMHGKILLHL